MFVLANSRESWASYRFPVLRLANYFVILNIAPTGKAIMLGLQACTFQDRQEGRK